MALRAVNDFHNNTTVTFPAGRPYIIDALINEMLILHENVNTDKGPVGNMPDNDYPNHPVLKTKIHNESDNTISIADDIFEIDTEIRKELFEMIANSPLVSGEICPPWLKLILATGIAFGPIWKKNLSARKYKEQNETKQQE